MWLVIPGFSLSEQGDRSGKSLRELLTLHPQSRAERTSEITRGLSLTESMVPLLTE